ncbi:MAG: DUF6702 family protein [Flavobacteriaceae bacterium]
MSTTFSKYLFILLAPLLIASSLHKFYVSVTNMQYDESNQGFQITTRIFIDDLEDLLEARYEIDARLGTEQEDSQSGALIEKYLRSKILIKINGELKRFTYLGSEYKDDLIICYMELPGIELSGLNALEIENNVLMELFEEQQNVVHIKIGEQKKSFILVRENNKGMLNF